MDRATARVGLAARGLVYVLMGILAVQMAFVDRAAQADQQGAGLGQNDFGKAVLWLVISALSAMACGKPPKPLGHRMSAMIANAPPD
jgi:Domain of Unknown Function (DUF1206)